MRNTSFRTFSCGKPTW